MQDNLQIHGLPPQVTSFVGRQDELSDIIGLLTDPGCRLLTLVGPGGIGKSRLAIQAAAQVAPHFGDGVRFVSLQPAHTEDEMLQALADALALSLSGSTAPLGQIMAALREQKTLLLLDNVEQLLPSVGILAALLQQAPGLKLLVTSREVLNLQEEWLYPLHGLTLPQDNDPAQLPDADAIRLFVERARRVRTNFSLQDECQDVGRICRLVEGMPLAIELAASWMRDMECAAIAAEIERNAGFLSTRLRNVPDRHRSLPIVFEQTWSLLSPAEQETYRAISVFENGFRREAAQAVAGASLAILTTLVDKSLLRVDAQGRYQLHNLLRQFARERLDAQAGAAHEACRRHAAYYLNFLAGHAQALVGDGQLQATRAIAAELDNVRTAWRWAVDNDCLPLLRAAGGPLQIFYDFQGRFREELDVFDFTIQSLSRRSADPEYAWTLATLLPLLGWSEVRTGRLDQAHASFSRSIELFARVNKEPTAYWGMDPLPGLGLVASIKGDYAQAIDIARRAATCCEVRQDNGNLQIACYVWQNAAQAQGDYETARRYAEQGYALTEVAGNRWMMAYMLSELGNIALAQSQLSQARRYFTAGYEHKESLNDPEGMATALLHLAHTALLEADYTTAAQLYQESETVYRRIHDQGGLAHALHGQARVAVQTGNLTQAAALLGQAFHIAEEMQWTPMLLALLVTTADLLQRTGAALRAVELLSLVRHHPSGDHQTQRQCVKLLEICRAQLSPASLDAAQRRGAEAQLHVTVTTLHLTLATLHLESAQDETSSSAAPTLPTTQPLVEPLTARELEVLALMADGLTNQEIADRLIVAIGTVKSYTSQIYGKLGVRNRIEAVARAQEIALL